MTAEDRLAQIQEDINLAGREASFCEDRGFGGLNADPYRDRLAAHFQEEPLLQRLLPVIWRELQADYNRFFTNSDGACKLDFIFAHAALNPSHELDGVTWIQGQGGFDPTLQCHAWDEGTFILRQNPNSNREAPFLYLLLGHEKALLIDTGAPVQQGDFWPFLVHSTVTGLMEHYCLFHGLPKLELLVTHTHEDEGHCAADAGFRNQPGIQFLMPSDGSVDLGGRVVTMLPTPSGSPNGFSFYDSQRTRWLLTGDLLCPGQLDCASIARLVEFTALHPVTAVLGSHIETTGQPHLLELDKLCKESTA